MLKRIKSIIVAIVLMLIVITIPSNNTVFAHSELPEEDYVMPTAEEYVVCDDEIDENYENINTYAITYYTVSFTRVSDVKAKAVISAQGSATVTKMTSKVQLQKYNSNLQKYVNVKDVNSSKTVYTNNIIHSPKFAISSSGKYRVKVVISDGTYNQIKYKVLT